MNFPFYIKISVTLLFFLYSFSTFAQNQTDENGLKQGHWKIAATDTLIYSRATIMNDSSRDTTVFVTYTRLEGEYLNNVKTGIWTSSNSYHKISTITLLNGKPNGETVVYYANGTIRFIGNIEKDSKTVNLKTRVIRGKYYSNVTVNVEDFVKKWTFVIKVI